MKASDQISPEVLCANTQYKKPKGISFIQLIEDGVKCKGVSLDTITNVLYNKLQEIFLDHDITEVLLENQPVLKNPVMNLSFSLSSI